MNQKPSVLKAIKLWARAPFLYCECGATIETVNKGTTPVGVTCGNPSCPKHGHIYEFPSFELREIRPG